MRKSNLLVGSTLFAVAMSISQPAFAQNADANSEQGAANNAPKDCVDTDEDGVCDDDVILVTGSRIPRPQFEGGLPIAQISSEQIASRGFTNVLEALNDNPLFGPGASPLTGNNGGQAASLGAAFGDLLDLGTPRTLTLVNGRRFVSGNAASLFVEGNATGSQVDLNSIPSSLIARIDILTVGGAAAYGADAIAGVVNVVLKDKYEGLELRALGGVSDRQDAGQYQLSGLAGRNFLNDRLNVVISAEYTRSDGVQADSRDFRLRRASTITNFANGAVRNSRFAPAIIDVANANNGAFLRSTDDGVPASAFGEGFINQTLSFNGTILNTLATPQAYYTPLTQTVGGVVRTSNFIALQNGIGTSGFTLPTSLGNVATTNLSFFNTATQLVNGLPGATLISGNGRNGAASAIANLPITTFAPTSLPSGVTAAQVFSQFNITPPAGSTASEQSLLAINVLQANRPTAREFFALNPNVNVNAFIGTFFPSVPRVANTDTTLVTVAGVQVPVNQVLPFVAVPLEFTPDGSVRNYTLASLTPTTPGTIAQAPGSNGGFSRSIENIVLRTQQDRYIGNFNATFELTPNITLFTENLYSYSVSVSRRNSPSQNFVTTGAENSALVLNVNNPFLDSGDLAALNAVGINAATRGGTFVLTRQNQDIFGDNPFRSTVETYRLVGGARGNWSLFGKQWSAEFSGTYGQANQRVETTQINDIEYQLALDAVRDPATGNIVCRAQLFPNQYLGFTPVGTVANLTRLPGADGIPTERVVTPTITQAQISACQPLNPFGFNQMSEAAKRYVRQDNVFNNVSKQTFLVGSITGGLFDLPAGTLTISGNAEYRRESLAFTTDELNRQGRGRAAPSANTTGNIEIFEYGGEIFVPVFGEDFLPFLGSLDINPGVRVSRQTGSAQQYRNLAGSIVSPSSDGSPAVIYTLGGTWRPIHEILIRGNVTRSVRQPSVVELFLGGQPAFATPTDPCGPNNIGQGTSATVRRANCRADVISRGLATDIPTADAFLASFVPNPNALPGTFSGASGLSPEVADSWTVGGSVTPRFIPGLAVSADYFSINLSNIIQPTNLAQALQFCYESTTYPDTSPQTGANTCGFFTRQTDFQVAPGFASGFINLAATRLRSLQIQLAYNTELPKNLGNVRLTSLAYHLITYSDSAAGDFSDQTESAGTFNRPKWEINTQLRYSKGAIYTQLTWNWRSATSLFTNGAPSTIENFPNIGFPAVNTFDLAVGVNITDKFRAQFNVTNLTDVNYAGETGLYAGAYVDQIGRRFQFSIVSKF